MSQRIIRLAVTLDHLPSAFIAIEVIEDDTTPELGNYDVTMDDLRKKTQTKAKVLGFSRLEHTGIELIARACDALAETQREAVIP